jgi:hypothetical protein
MSSIACLSTLFPNNYTYCPISFAQKCWLALYIAGLKGSTFIIHLIGIKNYNLKIIKRIYFWVKDQPTRFIAKKNIDLWDALTID